MVCKDLQQVCKYVVQGYTLIKEPSLAKPMNGWLDKKGKDILGRLKKRWCVFNDKTRCLDYYDKKDGSTRKLKGHFIVKFCKPDSSDPKRFVLQSEEEVPYTMAASSEEQADKWLNNIRGALAALHYKKCKDILCESDDPSYYLPTGTYSPTPDVYY